MQHFVKFKQPHWFKGTDMSFNEKNKNAKSILRQIVKKYCSSRFVHTPQFLELLRNHHFQSMNELNEALVAYCDLVLTKEVRYAVFVDLPDSAPISALDMQTYIQRGMTRKVTVNEFIGHGGLAVPKWYLDARSKLDALKQEQD